MRFFLDENFPATAQPLLEAHGHEVFRAVKYHPHGADDRTLFLHAQRESAVFLTTDKDFFHTVPFLYPERTAAVVSITLDKPNRDKILARLGTLLVSTDLINNPMGVFLVTDTRILKRT